MSGLKRRDAALALALGGAALGVGGWLRHRQAAVQARASADPPSSAALALPALTPIPAPIRTMDGRLLGDADIGGRFVLLNFWAPWCPPCVKEMPEIDRFARSDAGRNVLVIGLAIDEQPAVERFVAAHPVSFPIAILGYAGLAWARRLSNDPNVALPFTAVFDRSQRLARHKFGATNAAELTDWVRTS
jgi:thiol-disulfide isomerase/thioredoxin